MLATPSSLELTSNDRFRDEDRLAYRWDRTVDGSQFVRERVGGILANGFKLGGRSFVFGSVLTFASVLTLGGGELSSSDEV